MLIKYEEKNSTTLATPSGAPQPECLMKQMSANGALTDIKLASRLINRTINHVHKPDLMTVPPISSISSSKSLPTTCNRRSASEVGDQFRHRFLHLLVRAF